MKIRRPPSLLFALPGAVLFTISVSAQLASDQVPRERTLPRRETMRRDLEDARLRLGPFRIRPMLGLRDMGYENNVFGTEADLVSDWRATVTAGADAILPMGRKTYLLGTIAPEYTWYSKLASRRALGGTYGGSFLALFNRVSLETGAEVAKTRQPVSSEIERSVLGTRNDVFVRTEVDIFRRLAIFGSAETQTQRFTDRNEEQFISLERLERDETYVRAGVRYKVRSYLGVTAALEEGRTEFNTVRERDNDTHAVLFGVNYDRPRLFISLSAGQRRGEAAVRGSGFPSFSTPTGSYYVEYELASRPVVDFYGKRSVAYSVTVENPYFFETRSGVGLTIPIGQRFGVRVLGEVGTNEYQVPLASGVKRSDDVTSFGGGVAVRLRRSAYLSIVASETRYDSNLDFDRSVFRVSTLISLRGKAFQ